MRINPTKSTHLSTYDAASALMGDRLLLRGCYGVFNRPNRRPRTASVPACGSDAPPSTARH